MAQQTIVFQFENRSDAEKAVAELVGIGIPRSDIRVMPETDSGYRSPAPASSYDYRKDEGGFWASLGNLFIPDEDRYAYAEGMSRGAVTVSVVADEAKFNHVADIADRYGAVDMDERESGWRASGWKAYDAAGAGVAATTTGTGTGTTATAARTTAAGVANQAEEAIPIVEEQLRVGKRQVDRGRVRIRSYVIETPVQEQVSLREEHVHVERRSVDRPVTAADEALFRERTIEATEHAEEAVVSKEARVREELVIRKDAEERTETVRDTVRRTEVEVEDSRVAEGPGPAGVDPVRTPR